MTDEHPRPFWFIDLDTAREAKYRWGGHPEKARAIALAKKGEIDLYALWTADCQDLEIMFRLPPQGEGAY